MKKLLGLFLILSLLLCFFSCKEEAATGAKQTDFISLEMEVYGTLDPALLSSPVISLPKELAITNTDDEQAPTAAEEDMRHATEDALLAYLLSVYTPKALPVSDVTYNFSALGNYYASLMAWEHEIRASWGEADGISRSLGGYLAKTWELDSPFATYGALLEEAKAITQESLTVTAAFFALGLSLSEAEVAALTLSLAEEDPTVLSDPAYVRNLLLWEKTMDTLASRARIVWI